MKKVVFSQRAYLSVLAEVYEHITTETGGVLLGHRSGDTWYAVESIEPGPKSTFTPSLFEYDEAYVEYRANKISRLYKRPLQLLGLWHRHPGVYKSFSSVDDGTNKIYTDMLNGAISGLVTLGNGFEITMYYVPSDLRYETIEWVVGDEQIPEEYLAHYQTEYYRNLINEASVYQQSPSRPEQGLGRVDSRTEEQASMYAVQKKRSLFDWIKEDFLSLFSEKDGMDQPAKTARETPPTPPDEIEIILNALDREIAYIQSLNGVDATMAARTATTGKRVLALSLVDSRGLAAEQSAIRHVLLFFVSGDKIMVRFENGENQVYAGNTIATLLGGKS